MGANNADFFKGRVTHLTARQIMGKVFYGDSTTQPKSGKDALEMKYAQASLPKSRKTKPAHLGSSGGLKDEILSRGYDNSYPVHILLHDDDGTPNPQLLEGHHRVAVMFKHHPDQPIAVKIWKNFDEFHEHITKNGESIPGAE